jgi:hypothetical protein
MKVVKWVYIKIQILQKDMILASKMELDLLQLAILIKN